jgi:hypothetical protein
MNSIQARLTKSRNAADIRNATMLMIEKLALSGHPPKLYIMDNEASVIIKAVLVITRSTISSYHHTFIDEIRQNELSKHLKHTSFQVSAQPTQITQQLNGIA